MRIQVKLFATLKDKAGSREVGLDLPDTSTVADLKTALSREVPALAASLPTALVSVNHAYAYDQDPIQGGDEIALFPPVSGG